MRETLAAAVAAIRVFTAANLLATRLLGACLLAFAIAGAGTSSAQSPPCTLHSCAASETKTKPAQAQAEAARHSQRRLLDAAIAALAPHDPGKINMYLLAVAGDGAQEVFHREVDFVREHFATRFGMKDHTLALVNSRNTLTSAPMATRANLREALRGIAARMDTRQDILFLFLTSHGSRNHEFSLAPHKMKPRALPARTLGALLRDSGIRWKVVVVSACYSGGFIDALKDEHTLIITAARRDRPSFGCDDENEFTYFGRAFFKEALPGARSFEDAFAKAAALVRQWEDEEQKPAGKAGDAHYSYPQMHSPAPVRLHLQRWWNQHGSPHDLKK